METQVCRRCGQPIPIPGGSAFCPHCGQPQTAAPVPPPAETAAVTAERPPLPEQTAPVPAPDNARPRRKRWPWLMISLAAASVLIAAVVYLVINRASRPPSDLDYIPGDAAAFISFRVADMADALPAETREWFGREMDQAIQTVCGLDLADIERVTAVLAKRPADGNRPDLWVSAKTKKPYDASRVRAALAREADERKHNGKTYFVSPDGAIHFLADDLLVFGTPEGMKDFLSRDSTSGGPLRNAV